MGNAVAETSRPNDLSPTVSAVHFSHGGCLVKGGGVRDTLSVPAGLWRRQIAPVSLSLTVMSKATFVNEPPETSSQIPSRRYLRLEGCW